MLDDERDVALPDGEEGVLGAGSEAVEQTMSAPEPAVADGVLAAEQEGVQRQPDRRAPRAETIAPRPVEAVGPLAGGEVGGGVVQPPGRHPETFQRLRRLHPRQGGLVAGARLRPGPTVQRRLPAARGLIV